MTIAKTKDMTYCALFTALLCICSFVRIQIFSPVPITMQVFAVFMAGIVLGKKWGTLSMVIYLLLGVAGLPVFSGFQSGIGMVAGPTGGFLLGFIPGVFVIGSVYEKFLKKRSILSMALAMSAGALVIYACGTCQLMAVAHMTVVEALLAAVLPFVVFDAIKMALAIVVLKITVKI